jgi:hypothetical protein
VRFYTSSSPPEIKNRTSTLALLISGFMLLILIPSVEFSLLLYNLKNHLIDTIIFLTLLQPTQIYTYLGRIQPIGPLQIMASGSGWYLRYRDTILKIFFKMNIYIIFALPKYFILKKSVGCKNF